MACEKYTDWLTEAALGALTPGREAELRLHAAACSDCHSEWEALRSLVAAVDRGVGAMVAGQPSPQFAARLRARIAEEREPVAWPLLTWPRFALATLAAAAVLIAVFLVRPQEWARRQTPTPATTAVRIAEPLPSGKVAAPERNLETTFVEPRRSAARANIQAAAFSMEVLVPKGQIAAALVLSAGVSVGKIDGAQLVRLAERSAEPLELKTLDIRPLASPSAAQDAAKAASTVDDGRK